MVEEYALPINEGPVPVGPRTLRRYSGDETPVDLSKIDLGNLDALCGWRKIIDQKNCGIDYRVGFKECFEDESGDLVRLLLFFQVPFTAPGVIVGERVRQFHHDCLYEILEKSVIEMSNIPHDNNVMGLLVTPPEPIVKVLRSLPEW